MVLSRANSYSRGVQTERLLREQKHNFGACLSRQRYLPTNPKKTRVQNWTDLGSKIDSFHGNLVFMASRPLFGVAWGIRPPASYNIFAPNAAGPGTNAHGPLFAPNAAGPGTNAHGNQRGGSPRGGWPGARTRPLGLVPPNGSWGFYHNRASHNCMTKGKPRPGLSV